MINRRVRKELSFLVIISIMVSCVCYAESGSQTTNMNTKEIRDSMRIYKKRYYDVKLKLINE